MCRMRNWYVKLASRDVTFNNLDPPSTNAAATSRLGSLAEILTDTDNGRIVDAGGVIQRWDGQSFESRNAVSDEADPMSSSRTCPEDTLSNTPS
jgi:hypothetical protein